MDILTYGLLNKKVEEAKNVSGEKITAAVNTYLDENPPVTGATAEQAAQIDKNVADIGELKGDLVDLGTGKIDKPTTANNNKIPRANNGEVEWVEVGQPTDEQTETAVTNWLDDHPEATTTVQDGSLTENKFTEDLRNHTIKDYVTPEMFGAVGDGTTDDVLAIESAINTKKPILLTKKYYISRPINIIDNTRIYGDRINRRYDQPIDTCYIKSMSGFFHNANGVNMVFLLDIALWNLDDSKPVFDCALDRCVFRIYGYNIGTFANSLQGCCFNDSYFLNSAGNFSNYTSDTKFSNCYISGNTEKRNSVFTGTVSALFMSDCYLDFWYEVFKPSYSTNNMVTNNVFDACYHVFVGDYHGFGVINNVFMRIKDSVLWTLNKDDWCVFCNGLRNNTRSIGNKVDADYYIHTKLTGASYPNSNSISIGNSLNNTTKIVWKPYPNDSTDLLNTRVEEINFKTYDTLPNPVLTDGSNERFNHQFAEHNGAMYLNQNGKWKQISGTKEVVKEVSAMTIPAHSVSSVLVTEFNVISNIFYIARPNKKLTGVVYDCYSYTDTEIRIDIANPTDQEVSLPDITWKVKGFN